MSEQQKPVKIMDNIYDDMRIILNQIPNKNSLYRDIDLNTTYLNLKHFAAGKERLKEKSENALLNKLGYKKVILYVKEDDLTPEEKTYINVLQVKFLEELNNYIQKFLNEKKRFTKNELNKDEINKINEILNQAKEYDLNKLDLDSSEIKLDLDNLTIK